MKIGDYHVEPENGIWYVSMYDDDIPLPVAALANEPEAVEIAKKLAANEMSEDEAYSLSL